MVAATTMAQNLLAATCAQTQSKVPACRRTSSTPSLTSLEEKDKGVGKDGKEKNIYYWDPKSLRIRTINFWHVFLAQYMEMAYYLTIAVVVLVMIWQWSSGRFDLQGVRAVANDAIALEAVAIAAMVIAYVFKMKPSVYCVDNVVFVPPKDWQVSRDDLLQIMRAQGCFDDGSMEFMGKLLEKSGTGDATHWPPAYLPSRDGVTKGQKSMANARQESQTVIFGLVRELLEKTHTRAKDIDFVVINCSLFTPTPSLCAMVCNEFGMRKDVRSYNLGGMGCSANVISVDLAKQLLQNEPGARALVISTENLTENLYTGGDKSMLLQNTLFRCGGCALLLSSRRVDSLRAKYKLLYTGRTQMNDQNSYNCVWEQEDQEGHHGVALSKDIVSVAGQAMKSNFVQLGPYVLPIREQIKTVANRILLSFVHKAKKSQWPGSDLLTVPRAYTPNFAKGIDHFCIHAGGRAVIEGVQKNLNLQEHHVQPSKQTLYDWGNTSSSSIWYEAEWVERFGNLKRGDRMLQIAFGSGFKCNSAVWLALRTDKNKVGQPIKETEDSSECPVQFADKAL
jgi:3-ketoacyl-CoA synthase|mmetsp:Transcript_109403/g.172459  ORF Transcript_109403/g.172459 Transcript_109403/m.172459 type:complete len:564 (-) Transcript_109403:219-1910(-)